jgi:hypothetical protein
MIVISFILMPEVQTTQKLKYSVIADGYQKATFSFAIASEIQSTCATKRKKSIEMLMVGQFNAK